MTIEIPSVVTSTMRGNAKLGHTTGRASLSATHQAYERQCGVCHYYTGTLIDLIRVNGIPPGARRSVFNLRRYLGVSVSFRRPNPAAGRELFGNLHTVGMLSIPIERAPFDRELARVWVRDLLSPHDSKAWYEPVDHEETDEAYVMHLRLFCDERWQPISAPPEYATELQRRGWQTWRQVLDGWDAKDS